MCSALHPCSYRRLALKYHPDINHEKAAQEEFLRICEAYEVLSDRESGWWWWWWWWWALPVH